VLEKCNKYLKGYTPGFGISGRVRQCLFNIWFAKDVSTPTVYERTYLTMSDGGTISVDWAKVGQNEAILTEPTLGKSMLESN